ncbi:phosphotransferase [Bradyrhizobium sp. CB82]|uniref:phosphotransferase n=1 Tax=Bradyrhizobium sp. CB82 TaxID=3039159 RepID=UPI0024B26174|nr:phosphotransferase [Bradyrhizobium sp. CB82]WFU38871.1 phosphotransferase [Bradyrhizobium sp. CB82]
MALFGEALAKLHGAALAFPRTHVRSLQPTEIWRDAIDALRPVRAFEALLPKINRAWQSAFHGVTKLGLPQGNCHGDAWTANARATDRRVTFFDFDESGHGPLMLDLGTQAWHLRHDRAADTGWAYRFDPWRLRESPAAFGCRKRISAPF